MTTLEIIAGAVLLFTCLLIVVVVSLQTGKGGGLTSAIMGGEGNAARGRAKDTDAKLASITKVLAIILFVVTLAVTIVTLATNGTPAA